MSAGMRPKSSPEETSDSDTSFLADLEPILSPMASIPRPEGRERLPRRPLNHIIQMAPGNPFLQVGRKGARQSREAFPTWAILHAAVMSQDVLRWFVSCVMSHR